MNTNKNEWERSFGYVKTVVEVVREPILILDKDLCVMFANDSFYRSFQVELKDTEKKLVYELGNGQWDIPALKKLLEDILPKNTFFKGFEVVHEFPVIGRKMMILNARKIHFKDNPDFPEIILLAIEDVTEIMAVAETLALHADIMEAKLAVRTESMEKQIGGLEKEIHQFKKEKEEAFSVIS